MATEQLNAKYMVIMLTQEGFMRWAQGKPIQITDVKPEHRNLVLGNFLEKGEGMFFKVVSTKRRALRFGIERSHIFYAIYFHFGNKFLAFVWKNGTRGK